MFRKVLQKAGLKRKEHLDVCLLGNLTLNKACHNNCVQLFYPITENLEQNGLGGVTFR